MLEIAKLQKLEREAHQWVQQALPNLEKDDIICLHMKRLIETAEEKDQNMGPEMEIIAEVYISEKMSILSGLTTLTINIQKVLQSWSDSQHHLAVTAPAIVEVCVQKRTTIRLHSPPQQILNASKNFVPPCFFRTKKRFVRGGDVEGASQ